jgi:hypothetical protein
MDTSNPTLVAKQQLCRWKVPSMSRYIVDVHLNGRRQRLRCSMKESHPLHDMESEMWSDDRLSIPENSLLHLLALRDQEEPLWVVMQ